MKRTSIILSIVILLFACKKEHNQTAPPQADFTFSNNNTAELRLATNDTTTLISNVSHVSAISWDLGDGRTSAKNSLVLSYPKAGTYTVKLVAHATDGQAITVTKRVIVLDRVLKTIIIDKVYWNTTDAQFAQAGWPLTNTADIYVRIQLLQGNDKFNGGFVPNAPVIYESAVIKNVSNSTTNSIAIDVASKVAIDKALLDNRMYLISLVAKNTTGEYMLFSNRYSGANQLLKADDITKNTFIINTSFFSSMNLLFDFE